MGQQSQRKGRAGERELVRLLREYGYRVEIGAALSFGQVPDVTGLRGIHIECKRVEKLDLCAALRQAAVDAARFADGLPAVFHRRNRQGWIVSMQLEDWLQVYHGIHS